MKYSPPRGMTHFCIKLSFTSASETDGSLPTISRGVPTPMSGSIPGLRAFGGLVLGTTLPGGKPAALAHAMYC